MQFAHSTLRSNILVGGFLLVAMISLSGCVMPWPHHEVYEGSEITPESLNWLQRGETTRLQVLQNLGAPDVDFVDEHVIAYAWSGTAYYLHFALGFHYGEQPIRMRRAFLVEFDVAGRVIDFSFIDRPTKDIQYDVFAQSGSKPSGNWKEVLDQWLTERRQKSPAGSETGLRTIP